MRFKRILLLASLLALVVTPVALAIRFTDASFFVPVGETGKPYFHKFDGAAGCGPALPYQYRLLSGTLPPGLQLHRDGTVDGIPTQTGEYFFYVELSDEDPPSQSWCRPAKAQRDFTIKIIQGLLINEQQPSLGGAFLNRPWAGLQLTTKGAGSSPLTWSITSGQLPPGITINRSTGQLSGTPTQVGDFTFKVTVTDGTRSNTQTYTLSIVPPIEIGKPTTPPAEVGLPFKLELTATGGRPPYKWSAEGLPSGLTMDPANGAVTGTPTAPNSGVLKVTVTDALNLKQAVDVSLPVAAKLALVKKALPTLKVGKKAKLRLGKIGGVAPFTWTILGGRPGTLPPGIKFSKRTGEFSGTPTKAGIWRLRLQLADGLNVRLAMPVVLRVLA